MVVVILDKAPGLMVQQVLQIQVVAVVEVQTYLKAMAVRVVRVLY